MGRVGGGTTDLVCRLAVCRPDSDDCVQPGLRPTRWGSATPTRVFRGEGGRPPLVVDGPTAMLPAVRGRPTRQAQLPPPASSPTLTRRRGEPDAPPAVLAASTTLQHRPLLTECHSFPPPSGDSPLHRCRREPDIAARQTSISRMRAGREVGREQPFLARKHDTTQLGSR